MIDTLSLRKVLTSKGSITIEAEMQWKNKRARCSVPIGTSVGKKEVKMFPRDVDFLLRHVKEWISELVYCDSQQDLDKKLEEIDSSTDFSTIGGAIALAISGAFFKGEHHDLKGKAPYLLSKVVGGGKHAKGPEIQEFLVMAREKTVLECAMVNGEIYEEIGKMLEKKDGCFGFGRDLEGGWVTMLDNEKILDIIKDVAEQYDAEVGIDVAASSFFKDGKYVYREKMRDPGEHLEYILEMAKKYDLFYIEDPLHEDDWQGFVEFTKKFDGYTVGDDLFCSRKAFLEKGVKMGACNGIIIKPNQAGTITRVVETIKYAKQHNYLPVISHRSQDTCDNLISMLAIKYEIPIMKVGIRGGERTEKINELIRRTRGMVKWKN